MTARVSNGLTAGSQLTRVNIMGHFRTIGIRPKYGPSAIHRWLMYNQSANLGNLEDDLMSFVLHELVPTKIYI